MKKIIALTLTIALILSLGACGSSPTSTEGSAPPSGVEDGVQITQFQLRIQMNSPMVMML